MKLLNQLGWLGEALLGLIYPRPVPCPLCGKSAGSFHAAREAVCGRCRAAIAELQAGLQPCQCCGRFFRHTGKPAASAATIASITTAPASTVLAASAASTASISAAPASTIQAVSPAASTSISASAVSSSADGYWYCASCQSSRPDFDFARAVGPYAGILREGVHKFKYLGQLSLAEPLGKLMAAVIREEFLLAVATAAVAGSKAEKRSEPGATGCPGSDAALSRAQGTSQYRSGDFWAGSYGNRNRFDRRAGGIAPAGKTRRYAARNTACVVPVPLHPQRLGERGFNQAELLAQVVARELGLTFTPGLLVRDRYTPSQTRLSREQRRLNLLGAFILDPGYSLSPNQAVLIVDDVLTTGSTGAECARVLRKATSGLIVLVTTATGGNLTQGSE